MNRRDFFKKAIAVYAHGHRIGYIPRAINTIPAAMMDQGRRLTASVRSVAPEAPPWEIVEIEVGVMQ